MGQGQYSGVEFRCRTGMGIVAALLKSSITLHFTKQDDRVGHGVSFKKRRRTWEAHAKDVAKAGGGPPQSIPGMAFDGNHREGSPPARA